MLARQGNQLLPGDHVLPKMRPGTQVCSREKQPKTGRSLAVWHAVLALEVGLTGDGCSLILSAVRSSMPPRQIFSRALLCLCWLANSFGLCGRVSLLQAAWGACGGSAAAGVLRLQALHSAVPLQGLSGVFRGLQGPAHITHDWPVQPKAAGAVCCRNH